MQKINDKRDKIRYYKTINDIRSVLQVGRKWFRLDNAAMIFPPISNKNCPNTFCLSATLDEKIDKEILERSLGEVLKSEDTFRVRLKKGLFWHYLEENTNIPVVEEESEKLMEYIDLRHGDGYLFRTSYYENRINVTFYHALTDGTGGLYFLKQLVYRYLVNAGHKIKTDGLIKSIKMPTTNADAVDTFLTVKNETKEKKIAEHKAFKTKGTPFERFGTGIIFGECAVDEVKKLSKEYNTTITGYLTAVYLYSIYKAYIENKNVKNKTVAISIPINIRKRHPSETKRNFTLVVRIAYDFSKGADFEDIVKSSAKQLKEKLTTPQIDAQIEFNVAAEKNFFIKILPRELKTLILKIAFNIRGTRQETTDLSNLGDIALPASMQKHVKNIRFILHTSKTMQNNLSMTGYNGKLYFAFSRRHIETDMEKTFFRVLAEKGVKCVVSSNNWEVTE